MTTLREFWNRNRSTITPPSVPAQPADAGADWPGLPEGWTYTPLPDPSSSAMRDRHEHIQACIDPSCGCLDLDPLVTRIQASMRRMAPRWTVKRERMTLYTGTGYHWVVRDPQGVVYSAVPIEDLPGDGREAWELSLGILESRLRYEATGVQS